VLYCRTLDNEIFRSNRVMWSARRFNMNLLPTHYCHSRVPAAGTYHQSKSEKTTVYGTAGPRRDPQTPTAWLQEHECTLTRFYVRWEVQRGEQYSSRINTCHKFPRFHKSTITLPTSGGVRGGRETLQRFIPPPPPDTFLRS